MQDTMLNPAGFLLWGLKPSKTQYYKRPFLLLGFHWVFVEYWVLSRGRWVLHPSLLMVTINTLTSTSLCSFVVVTSFSASLFDLIRS